MTRRLRRRRGEETRFPLPGSNWFRRPEADAGELAWKADLALLASQHRDLVIEVAHLPDADLVEVPEGSRTAIRDLVLGVAYHDIYHAGQVQLLKRLYRQAG